MRTTLALIALIILPLAALAEALKPPATSRSASRPAGQTQPGSREMDARMEEQLVQMQEMVTLLERVKDVATARAAIPELERILAKSRQGEPEAAITIDGDYRDRVIALAAKFQKETDRIREASPEAMDLLARVSNRMERKQREQPASRPARRPATGPLPDLKPYEQATEKVLTTLAELPPVLAKVKDLRTAETVAPVLWEISGRVKRAMREFDSLPKLGEGAEEALRNRYRQRTTDLRGEVTQQWRRIRQLPPEVSAALAEPVPLPRPTSASRPVAPGW